MTKKYNFVPYEPGHIRYTTNQVSMHSNGNLYVNKETIKDYFFGDTEFAAAYIDRESKIIAFKFYEKKDIYGKQNLLKVSKSKNH